MSSSLLLAAYCLLIAAASLFGGLVPLVVKITHRRMQLAISFVGGVMLGVGLLHMIPHGVHEVGSVDVVVFWAVIGFLLMFFLQRFFHFHHHDAPDDQKYDDELHDEHANCDHTHPHDHAHAHDHNHIDPTAHSFSWTGAFVGLAIHSLVDGFALAAAVKAESTAGVVPLLAGFGTFLAIVLHKPFDSLSISTLMAAGGWSTRSRHTANIAYGLVVPCGVALFYLGVAQWAGGSNELLGRALGFAGGAFLCIATSDLLPELQFHSHDRVPLSVSLLLGVLLAWGVVMFESRGHDHRAHPPGMPANAIRE